MVATVHKITLFRQQRVFCDDSTYHVGLATGVGGGKSYCGAAKALKYAVLWPKSVGVITAPSYTILRDATLPSIRSVWPEELTKGFHPSSMSLTVPNGSEVLFRTTDDPNMLRGPNLAWAWMDEAARSSLEAFKVLQGRLRQSGYPHQIWLTTTPNGFTWFYDEFARPREVKRENYALHHWSARDNPFLPPEFVKNLEESYTPEFALQEIDGEFTVVGGNAYFNLVALKEMLLDCSPGARMTGLVTRWKSPMVGNQYVMGVDTAWGKTGSYSCAVVLDRRTAEQVAELHGRPDLDDLAQVLYDLHLEYNRAYLMPEWAGDEDEGQYVVRKLVELGAGDWMYYRDSGDKREQPGFVTNVTTRPYILSLLEVAVRKKAIVPRCKEWVQEMMSFVRDEHGRPAAAKGMKDDHVMAGALAMRALEEFPLADQKVAKVVYH